MSRPLDSTQYLLKRKRREFASMRVRQSSARTSNTALRARCARACVCVFVCRRVRACVCVFVCRRVRACPHLDRVREMAKNHLDCNVVDLHEKHLMVDVVPEELDNVVVKDPPLGPFLLGAHEQHPDMQLLNQKPRLQRVWQPTQLFTGVSKNKKGSTRHGLSVSAWRAHIQEPGQQG